jgi:hypothetical protein
VDIILIHNKIITAPPCKTRLLLCIEPSVSAASAAVALHALHLACVY